MPRALARYHVLQVVYRRALKLEHSNPLGTHTIIDMLLLALAAIFTAVVVTIAAPAPQNALHTEACNATYKNSGCGRHGQCNYRRANNDGLNPPGNLTLDRFSHWPCFCDVPECRVFGDCCADVVSETWQKPRPDLIQGLPASAWQCHRFADLKVSNKQNEETLDRVRQFTWMVAQCPDESDPTTERYCSAKAEDLGDEYTYVLDIPVIVQGTLFRNVFCASCYGHAPTDFMPLSLELHCRDKETQNSQISRARYVAGEARWELPEENVNCSLEVREYSNLVQLNVELKQKQLPLIRQCQPLVASCPPSWQDTQVIAKCAAYSLLVIESDVNGSVVVENQSIRYKNPHCAMCHGIKMVKCVMGSGTRSSASYPGSLSLIFHFAMGGEIVGQRDCSTGFVWDALYKQCRPVFSCKGRYVASHCPRLVPDVDSSSEIFNLSSCNRVILESNEYHLLDNGSLLHNHTLQVTDKYHILADSRAEICADDVLISEEDTSEFSELQGLLTLVFTCFSLLGLALHVCVLLTLPRLRNLPGLISMSTSMALFAAQALFLWATSAARPGEYSYCVFLAAVLHFCYLKVFTWTSIMSYDIWRTFSHPTGHMRGRRSYSQRTQFAKYVIFASAVPACIVACSLSLDLVDSSLTISPKYALASLCWFGSRTGLALFFVLPVAAMLLSNLIMYAIVVTHIREQRKASRFLVELSKRGDDAGHDPKYSENDCKLHFSIFNVMGGTWILGLLAGLINHPILWYIFIVLLGSQGVVIFILQIMKPRVWDMLRNKLTGRDELSSRTSSTLATSSLTNNKANSKSIIKHAAS